MSNRPKPTRALIAPTEPPKAPPCLMVVFGAAGDLAKRLLVPSLYNLTRDGLLEEIEHHGGRPVLTELAHRHGVSVQRDEQPGDDSR